jgi:hypothetical protein
MSQIILAQKTLKKLYNLLRNHLLVHSKSNIKVNTSICVSFMCVRCKNSPANLKLTDNLIISPDTSTVHGELQTVLAAEAGSFWTGAATDVNDGKIRAQCHHTNLFRTYKFRTADKALSPLSIFGSRNL